MKGKRMIKIFFGLLVFITVILSVVTLTSADEPDGSTPEKIEEFIKSCGYSVASPSVKDVTIPSVFSEVYENYNRLQKEQDFDLSKHKGEAAVSYTFPVIGYRDESGNEDVYVEIHILVQNGKIIGGDIASTRLDGFMKPLRG